VKLFLHQAVLILCALRGTTMFLAWLSYCSPVRADTFGQCLNCFQGSTGVACVPSSGSLNCHQFTGVPTFCTMCTCVRTPRGAKCF